MGLLVRFLAWLRTLLLQILAHGPIPRHVAFIMDGNRRFAKKIQVPKIKGHQLGFKALERILDWCMQLGVKEVTVYAFSIENFKRPKDEVDGLMDLAADKFANMMEENKMIDKLGIRVCVPGELDLLPEKLRSVMEKVMDYSKDNTRATLNVCFAYTAREEMTGAVRKMTETAQRLGQIEREGMWKGSREAEARMHRLLKGEAVGEKEGTWGEEGEKEWGWEDEVWQAMQVDSAPELLIRTSGEIRFSDFLLWQTTLSCVIFLNVLWPDFTLWHFLYTILLYQVNWKTMKERRKYYAENIKNRRCSDLKIAKIETPTTAPTLDQENLGA
jgi:ditrans,polycis-polyprenyl diphosphate synthase